MKKRKLIFAIIIILLISVGILSSTKVIKAYKEPEGERQVSSHMVRTPSPKNVDTALNETPSKLVDLLKMPTEIPFKVNDTEASVDDLLNREEMAKLENGDGKSDINEEKVLGDTKSFPFNEVTYEQVFVGDDINLSVLANAQEVEMVYEDPSMVNKIQLEDGSSAEYIDYGFNQQIVWKDSETEVTYIINVNMPDEEGTGKLTEEEMSDMIGSFESIKE